MDLAKALADKKLDLLTVQEAAARLGVTPDSIYQRIHRDSVGDLVVVRIGRSVRIAVPRRKK